jgi:alpha-galactosidase
VANVEFKDGFPREQIIPAASLTIDLPSRPGRFFRHGWQSWSLAAWTDAAARLPIQKPRLLHPLQSDPLYARHAHPHGSWVGAVELGKDILLLGSLGLDAHVELKENHLHGWYESGQGDWFISHGTENAIFARYAQLLGQRLGSSPRIAPRLWCSWYSLYTAIDELVLRRILDGLDGLPFDVIQIDDGWQVSVGDWEANEKFPAGMAALAGKIAATGRKAGLWLAPLIAVKSSRLFKEHRDWFLKDHRGGFVSAGFNWGEPLCALDTTHPEALHWLEELMKKVRQWGYEYIKLDFLYGGALPGRRASDVPREVAYRDALKVMRRAMGSDAFFLACGAPILPSLGVSDALRVGPDVAGEWENTRDSVLLHNPTIPGVKNAIRTSLHRLWLGPLVRVDPDVAYFGSSGCSLSVDQKSLLRNLALVCGFRATSDIPQWLTGEERETLREFLEKSPAIEQRERYEFMVGADRIDFSPALPMPQPLRGLDALKSVVLGWLAEHPAVLRLSDGMNKRAWKRTRERIGAILDVKR